MMKLRRIHREDGGISLIEVMVSILILSILFAGMSRLVVGAVKANARGIAGSRAATIAQAELDKVLNIPLTDWAYKPNSNELIDPTTSIVTDPDDHREYEITKTLSAGNILDPEFDPEITVVEFNKDDGVFRHGLVKVSISVKPANTNGDEFKVESLIAGNTTKRQSSDSPSEPQSINTVSVEVIDKSNDTDAPFAGVTVKLTPLNKDNTNVTSFKTGITKSKGTVRFTFVPGDRVKIEVEKAGYVDAMTYQTVSVKQGDLIHGGERKFKVSLYKGKKIDFKPVVMGVNDCQDPYLRFGVVPKYMPNNAASKRLTEVLAYNGKMVEERKNAVIAARREYANKPEIPAAFIQCKDRWFMIDNDLPIQFIDNNGNVRSLGNIGDANPYTWDLNAKGFEPSTTDGSTKENRQKYVQEAEWPKINYIDSSRSGLNGKVAFGYCVPEGVRNGPVINSSSIENADIDASVARQASNGSMVYTAGEINSNSKTVFLPIYPIFLEGWNDTPSGFTPIGSEGTRTVSIRNLTENDNFRAGQNSTVLTNGLSPLVKGCSNGKSRIIANLKETSDDNFEQFRMALPFGVYSYSGLDEDHLDDVPTYCSKTQNLSNYDDLFRSNHCFNVGYNTRYYWNNVLNATVPYWYSWLNDDWSLMDTNLHPNAKRLLYVDWDKRTTYRNRRTEDGQEAGQERKAPKVFRGPVLEASNVAK